MQRYTKDMAKGLDVSYAQGDVNWTDVKKAGNSFAFIKATEGETGIDPKFVQNYKAAKAVGIIRGPYCFGRPLTSNPQQEVNALVKLVKDHGGFDELPAVLDLEDLVAGQKKGRKAIVAWAHEWLNLCDSKTGKKTILYTNPNFFNLYLDGSFKGRPLWIADYGVSAPPNLGGIDTWTFFQYTDRKWDGQENTDSDYFNGTVEELKVYAGMVHPPAEHTAVHTVKGAAEEQPVLKLGSHGSAVKEAQALLHMHQDGIFGPVTLHKVKVFQNVHHLHADGEVGPKTWAALLS